MTEIFSLPLNVFRKSAICPRSEDLLSLTDLKVNLGRRVLIDAHLERCEFCRAELHLLRRHRPKPETMTIGEMPVRLRRLAEYWLRKDPLSQRLCD